MQFLFKLSALAVTHGNTLVFPMLETFNGNSETQIKVVVSMYVDMAEYIRAHIHCKMHAVFASAIDAGGLTESGCGHLINYNRITNRNKSITS